MIDLTSVSLLHRMQDSTDSDAWSRFHDEYRGFIFAFLTVRSVDDHVAEDICQNVLKQVYEALSEGRFRHNGNPGAFRKWLRRIVATQLGIHRRKTKRHEPQLPHGIEGELECGDSPLVQQWDEEHNRATLNAVLDLLQRTTPEESLAIFRRTFVEGASADSVAREFGRSKNAVIVVKCKLLKKARELASGIID